MIKIYSIFGNSYDIEQEINLMISSFEGKNCPNFTLLHDNLGKPYLLNSVYKISITDSNDLKLVAISDDDIGIDCEFIRDFDYKLIAKRLFENEQINSCLDFFNYWTKKEAISKYYGLGLRLDFNKIDTLNNKELVIQTFNYLEKYVVSVATRKKENVEVILWNDFRK